MSTSRDSDSTETAANDERRAAGPARRVRAAVVQMDFHPAVPVPKPSALDDPLFDLKREASSLLPTSGDASRVVGPLKLLRRRVRAAYLDQTRRKVEAILDACRAWEVQIVVFPEYSIPPALLEAVAQRAGDMVVVAGTHYVDQETLEQEVYEKLGASPQEELLEHAVSPVLHQGRLIGLVPKLQKTTPEHTFLQVSNEWAPVELPEGLPGPLGVLICLDNLSRQSAAHREHVGGSLARCRFIAAPSLTPAHSLDEVYAKALEDTRRQGRPVLFANHGEGGGSTIYVDEGKPPNVRDFPAHAGRLDPGEEGVVVADIDLGLVPVGSSTRYEPVPAIRPFAAASFVYAGVEIEYAAWLEKLSAQLDAPSTRRIEHLRDVKAVIGARPALGGKNDGAQQRRFQVLALELEDESSIERLRQLTREIVLPEEVLPLKVLQAALARGAADEVQRWVNELEAGEFGLVANRLRKEWKKVELIAASWSAKARRAADAVSDAVRGEQKATDPKVLIACVEAYEAEVERGFEVDNEKASEHFKRGRYAEARDAYRTMLEQARTMIERAEAAGRPSLRRWVARCQLNVALASLNLQELDEGRALILAITADDLPLRGKLQLAGALVLTGEREKAEEILTDDAEMAEADRAQLVEIRQTMELLDGRVPDPLADSAPVYVRAAAVLAAQGNLAAAAECALGAIQRSKGNALTKAFAVQSLTEALRRTILELPPEAELIPVERRGAVVEALEAYFTTLPKCRDLPATVREDMNKVETIFRGLIDDTDWISTKFSSDDADRALGGIPDNSRKLAVRLALEGRTEEAIGALLLDPDTHPWRGRFDRVDLLKWGNQLDRALDEALRLCAEYPDRARVEHITATLLRAHGRHKEALDHAEKAYAQLPGIGYRLLLADLRYVNGDVDGAWELLVDYRDDDRPDMLRAWAFGASTVGRFDEAIIAWRRYTERQTNDGSASVQLAMLLFRVHKPEEAAAVAWSVFQEHGDRLDLNELVRCGALQRQHGDFDSEQKRRIRAVVALIEVRFPTDPRAKAGRAQLFRILGESDPEMPNEAPAAHFSPTIVLSDRSELERRETFERTVTAYARLGAIPTSTARSLTGTPIALFIERILGERHDHFGYLCAPVLDQSPMLQGTTILISDLELILLEKLDILSTLKELLGPDGRLVYLPQTEQRLAEEFSQLRIEANPVKLNETEDTLRRLERTTDADSLSELREERDRLLLTVRAASLADKAHARLGNNWVQRVHAPSIEALLPLAIGDKDDLAYNLRWRSFREYAQQREVILHNSEWWRLTAELYGSTGPVVLFYPTEVPDLKPYLTLFERWRPTAGRDFTLPTLIRILFVDAKERDERLLKLAELGFADALGADEIIRLSLAKGLDTEDSRRILDHQEWMAREPGHHGGDLARLRLAQTYADAIVKAYAPREGFPAMDRDQAKMLALTLLSRQDAISEASATDALDQTLTVLAIETLNRPDTLWRLEGERYSQRTDGPIVALWLAIAEWAGPDGARRTSYQRAIRNGCVALDVSIKNTPVLQSVSLLMMYYRHWDQGGVEHFDAPSLEAVAILSALGETKPLANIPVASLAKGDPKAQVASYEELLSYGAAQLPAIDTSVDGYNERSFGFRFPFGENLISTFAPIEALFLRIHDDLKGDLTDCLKMLQGRHDGVLYNLLDAPRSEDTSREYARRAVLSPFRLVRDDPSFLRIWPASHSVLSDGNPPTLRDLRRLLSEPDSVLPDKTLVEILCERVETADGDWYAGEEEGEPAKRVDATGLVSMACEVPGSLPAFAWIERLAVGDDEYHHWVQDAIGLLDSPHEHPIARVAGGILFLRLAAAQRPLVKLGEGERDLREILPARLDRLLEAVSATPESEKHLDTMGAAEPALLRVCWEVVQKLVRSAALPFRDGLWLTYRLFQWLCLQLDAISPDARRAGIRRLVEHAPPPVKLLEKPLDRLDPNGFGVDRFDHRLATVLHALATMEVVVKSGAKKPRSMSSPGLEAKLIAIARQVSQAPSLGSVLDWNAPGNVPDLALYALLHVNSGRFADLGSEARTRRFEALPGDPQALEMADTTAFWLARQIVLAAAAMAPSLDAAERTLLEAKLRAMVDSPRSREWRWAVVVSFFAAGEDRLEEEARALTIEHVDHPFAPRTFGHFLRGVAARDAARIEQATESILVVAGERGADVVALATGALGQLLVHGWPAVQKIARSLLLQLAKRSPFREDPRMDELIAAFGLRESKS